MNGQWWWTARLCTYQVQCRDLKPELSRLAWRQTPSVFLINSCKSKLSNNICGGNCFQSDQCDPCPDTQTDPGQMSSVKHASATICDAVLLVLTCLPVWSPSCLKSFVCVSHQRDGVSAHMPTWPDWLAIWSIGGNPGAPFGSSHVNMWTRGVLAQIFFLALQVLQHTVNFKLLW